MTMFLALLLMAGAASADGPSLDPLTPEQADGGRRHCTADRYWCATIDEQGDVRVTNDNLPAAEASYPVMLLPRADEGTSTLWPHAIRFGDGVLMGVETSLSASYSGGGGQATHLHLILFHPGRVANPVLSVPMSANILIRACFSEKDMKRRAGACHDDYNFEGRLSLAGGMEAGMPILRYRTRATSYPGPVSRDADSLAGPPLTRRDLVIVTDPECSYERVFRFMPAVESYRPYDEPLPDCSSYTVP